MPEFKFRRWQPGDEEGIVALLELIFPNWPLNGNGCNQMDYWKWRYQENPYNNNILVVAENSGEIIGCTHSYAFKAKIGDQIRECILGADLAVHPSYRKMGVMQGVRDVYGEIHQEIGKFAWLGFSTNPITINYAKRRGWPSFPQPVNRMVRITDPELHYKDREQSFFKQTGFSVLSKCNKLKARIKKNIPEHSKYSVKNTTKFDKEVDLFWEKIKDHFTYIMVRESNYLNWRYSDKCLNYKKKVLYNDGVFSGFCVYRVLGQEDYPTGYIVDLLTFPGNWASASILLEEVLDDFDRDGINYVVGWAVKRHPLETVFHKHGFVSTPNNVTVSYYPITEEGVFDKIGDTFPRRLHFQYGDSDLI